MMHIREILRERKQARLAFLESEIFSSRMHVKAERLYVYAQLSSGLSGVATFLLLAYLSQLIIPLSFFLVFPVLGAVMVLMWLVIALAAMYGAFSAILYLPTVECGSRRLRIDLSMFNMTTYLYALHQSEPNLYEVVASLARYADYYGEAARELRQVVYDCRMCSMDFYSALGRLSETTPSDKFRFF
jgi:flagellar protein FlaJ